MLESLSENPINIAITVGAIILVIFILFRVAKTLLKVVLVVVVLGLAYYFWQGGTVSGLKDAGIDLVFKDANLSDMREKLCEGEKADKAKCSCIVEEVHRDVEVRLSEDEIAQANQDKAKIREEIRKSMKGRKKEILDCLKQNQGEKYMKLFQGLLTKEV